MEQIIKVFTGIFFLLLLFSLGMGILAAQLEAEEAKEYKAAVVSELENSNFSPSVINGCITQAKAQGYEMAITVYQAEQVVTYQEADARDTSGAYMAEVLLRYPYEIGVLNSRTMHSIRGYAG